MKRILWISPLPPARTDIANYTLRLAPELIKSADVQFCTPAALPCATDLPWRSLESLSARELNQADICIYHIGNNLTFHEDIFRLSRRHPGYVVLHDRSIHGLYADFLNLRNGAAQAEEVVQYLESMGQWYGQEGYIAAQNLLGGDATPDDFAAHFPLFEEALDAALGVITHNPSVTNEVRTRFPLMPCLHLPLPMAAEGGFDPSKRQRGLEERISLVAFGFMGMNRRLSEFIEAWRSSPWRHRFSLNIAGQLADWPSLREQLRKAGLAQQVRWHGYVSDTELDALLRSADLALNLRYPSMGEASGSQLRLWANGVPAVVTDTDWYAGLPDNVVFKVRPPEQEREDLLILLDNLANRALPLDAVAQAGWAYLRTQHEPGAYISQLMRWLDTVEDDAVRQWALRRHLWRISEQQAQFFPETLAPGVPSGLQ
ncbi:glycosyltransferase [Ectothiorhodospira haloalkaliphila]|uniref:glycosyltransferase n=1 Tax=Ectothiorhodospira haloalkaliphila TaxID=421628 RepID=UPI0009FD6859|nr:glycosyltransferase [Ectothiorhodospira haloalkaliphila]